MTKRITIFSLLMALCIFVNAQTVPQTADAAVAGGATQNNVYVAIGQPFYQQISSGSYEVAYSVAQAQFMFSADTTQFCAQVTDDDCNYRKPYDFTDSNSGTVAIGSTYDVDEHGYDVLVENYATINQVYSSVIVEFSSQPDNLTRNVLQTVNGCDSVVYVYNFNCPEVVVDADGNEYNTVVVANRCWTRENLKSLHYANGSDIQEQYVYNSVTYSDEDANLQNFGRLYTWISAINGNNPIATDAFTFDVKENTTDEIPDNVCQTTNASCEHVLQGVCPAGWHIPTSTEMTLLLEIDAANLRSQEFWLAPNNNNNSTNFTEVPAGKYNGANSRFEGLLSSSYIWYNGEAPCDQVYFDIEPNTAVFQYYCDQVLGQKAAENDAHSVRCVKDIDLRNFE